MKQTLADKFTLAAKIETEGREWESRAQTLSGFTQWEKGRILAAEIYHDCEIRLVEAPLEQDPHGRPLHNPDGLTGEQVGKGYRLLLTEEVDGRFAGESHWWTGSTWLYPYVGEIKGNQTRSTYRVPIATCPWPEPPAPAWTPKYKVGDLVSLCDSGQTDIIRVVGDGVYFMQSCHGKWLEKELTLAPDKWTLPPPPVGMQSDPLAEILLTVKRIADKMGA